jgi:hypothetical protein
MKMKIPALNEHHEIAILFSGLEPGMSHPVTVIYQGGVE